MVEVLRRFDLFPAISPFRRCLRCNALLNYVAKETILERLQTETRQYYDQFRICPACNRIYSQADLAVAHEFGAKTVLLQSQLDYTQAHDELIHALGQTPD